MKKESTVSEVNSGADLETNSFDHNNDNVWESIGLDPDSLDKNMEKFCDIMNQHEGGGKVSQGVETIMQVFSYKEVCFLAFKGLEMANTLRIGV